MGIDWQLKLSRQTNLCRDPEPLRYMPRLPQILTLAYEADSQFCVWVQLRTYIKRQVKTDVGEVGVYPSPVAVKRVLPISVRIKSNQIKSNHQSSRVRTETD